jgi:hypothetical protein
MASARADLTFIPTFIPAFSAGKGSFAIFALLPSS